MVLVADSFCCRSVSFGMPRLPSTCSFDFMSDLAKCICLNDSVTGNCQVLTQHAFLSSRDMKGHMDVFIQQLI